MSQVGRVIGGQRAEAFIRRALAASGVRSVAVGFVAGDRYDDGTPVAAVAAWNEFGAGPIPERPFMRRTSERLPDTLGPLIAARVDPETMTVSPGLAREIAEHAVGEMQREIGALDHPPNAPRTRKRGPGRGPLEDTGELRRRVGYRIQR